MGRFEHLELGAGRPVPKGREPPPTYDEVYYLAEGTKRFHRGDYEQALLSYSRALRFDANCEAAWVGQCKALIELSETEEALIWVDKGLQKFKDAPGLLACKGRVLCRAGDRERAISYVDAAIQTGKATTDVWLARADVLFAERSEAARHCLEKALEAEPDSWERLMEMTMICLRHDEALLAQRYGQRALQCGGEQPFLLCVLGDVHRALGEVGVAERYYQQALLVEREFKPALERLDRLGSDGLIGPLKRLFRRRR